MSLAEEMLATMSASDESVSYLADEEPHIIIDGTRKIIVPNALKLIAVQGDKDIETVTFDCVRYWDGNDLSSFAIYINYILPNKAEGTYIPQNVTRFDDIFSFEWKIGKEITHTKGSLTFWIVAKLTNDDADVIKQWSSLQNSECTIAQGGDKTYVPESQTDKDVISQVLSVSQASALRAEEAAISAENRYELVRDLTGSVVELSGNALRDAKRAEAAAEQSAVKADSSLLSAQNALQSERAAMEYESRARSSAESAARAATHAEAVVAGVNEKIERNSKRLTNLEQGLPDDENYTDATVAYTKDVPSNALPYAEVKKIGGMTRKCTNLLPFPYASNNKTASGLTWSINDDRSIKASGTSTGTSTFSFVIKAQMPSYPLTFHLIFSAEISGVQPRVYLFDEDDTVIKELRGNISSILYFSAADYPTAKKYTLEVAIITDVTVNNLTLKPMLNEGSTALPYEPYYEGLRDAKVTEKKSVGVNLIPFPYVEDTKNNNGVAFTVNGDGTITASGTAVDYNATLRLANNISLPAGTYRVTCTDTPKSGAVFAVMKNGVWHSETNNTMELLVESGDVLTIYLQVVVGISVSNFTFKPMLNKGSTALPYAPYMESTLPIPEAVQALDGYGWGVNADCYNYIDWEKKQFVKRVGKVVLDGSTDEGWVKYSDNQYGFPHSVLKTSSTTKCLTDRFTFGFSTQSGTFFCGGSGIAFFTDFATLDEWKAYLSTNPVMLYYQLATPEVTDISDLLSADNFLAVEGGGTVTAVNEYGYDVPSEIEYQLEV